MQCTQWDTATRPVLCAGYTVQEAVTEYGLRLARELGVATVRVTVRTQDGRREEWTVYA